MSALTNKRPQGYSTFKSMMLPLGAGLKAYAGARIYADTAAAVVKPGVAANANLQPIGVADFTVDNSAGTGTMQCQVTLDREIVVQWQNNATGSNAVTASSLFADVYCLDDQTVTTASSGNSKAGRVWALDAVKGVAVQAYWPY